MQPVAVKVDLDYEDDLTAVGALDKAAKEGFLVRLPRNNELFVDIDTEGDFALFVENYERLKKAGKALSYAARPSKSGGDKQHVIVTLSMSVLAEERLLLQACLGSDRVRELLGYLRAKTGNPYPTLFFEVA